MSRLTHPHQIVFVACLLAPLIGDAQSSAADVEATKITFDEHIKPIFRQHCANCHNQGDKKGGLAVDSYTALIEGGGSGEVVYDDGDVDASRLWQVVNHDDTPVMPPNQDKIPAEQLALLRAWIEGGILENSGSKAKAKKKNSLAFAKPSVGRPEGGGAMPESLPQQPPVITPRAAAVSAIATSPWAPLVAIAGQRQIVLYHADTSELLGVIPFDEGIPQSLRFSRDGSFLIAAGGEHSVNGIVAVYDVKNGQRVAVVGDDLDTVFGGDANDSMSRIAMGGPQKMLRIYDATDGSKLFDLKKHTDWIYSVAYSPDGILVASGDRSGGLCVWEADTGRLYLDLAEHKGAVHAIAWRDDSNVMASASEDGTVKVWDMIQGKTIKSINAHGGGVTDVSFDHEGRLVTVGKDNRAKLWDASGNHIRDFEPMSEDVLEVAITHDGKRVIYGDWTGKIYSALTDDPKAKAELAANPPPVSQRLETVKETLVSIQNELNPLKANLDSATAAMVAAQTPVDELKQKMDDLRGVIKKASEEAVGNEKSLTSIDNQLSELDSASRDLEDQVVVARVGLKSGLADFESVAVAEQKLAEHLLALVQKRRARVSTALAIVQAEQLVAKKTAELDQLSSQLPELQAKLDTQRESLLVAQKAYQQIDQKLQSVLSKRDQLAAELK